MKKELIEWCEKNSHRVAKFGHLCMESEKFTRGKKVNMKRNEEFMDRLVVLAEHRPDIGIDHNWSESRLGNVIPSALKYKLTKRTQSLAEPKVREEIHCGIETEEEHNEKVQKALNYKATKRQKELAKPHRRTGHQPRDYTKVKKSALNAKATSRIKKLAVCPKNKRTKKYKEREPQYVKPSALKATASPKTEELAKPRDHKDSCNKPNPFEVSKSALKYKASPRMKEISKPKFYTPKFVNSALVWKHRFDRDSGSSSDKSTQSDQRDSRNKNKQNKNKNKNNKNSSRNKSSKRNS